MGNRSVRKKIVWSAMLALAALLLFAACCSPPIAEEKKVEFAGIVPITGPVAASIQIQVKATQDYVRYFNEQAVIPSVPIEFLWGDTSMQPAMFFSHYEKFVARGVPVIWCMEGDALLGYKDRFASDHVVAIGSAIGFEDHSYDPGWMYLQCPTMAEQFAAVAEYCKENWKEERAPRLAFVGIESVWGDEPQPEGKKYAQSLGFEILPSEIVPYVVVDATAQLLRLKAQEADFVYMQVLPSSLAPTLRDAERLGLLDQMHFVGVETGMGEKVIQMTGSASEGYLMSMIAPWFDETDNPGIRLMIDKQMEYHGYVDRDNAYRNGWIQTAVICEAIKNAIENVGYENLDGVAIKQALDNMEDFDVDGLVTVTYKDRPFDHRGITRQAVYEVTGGNIVRMTDWREAPSLVPERLAR
jgi:branched-chain amino acid transport system substrate-binding protein